MPVHAWRSSMPFHARRSSISVHAWRTSISVHAWRTSIFVLAGMGLAVGSAQAQIRPEIIQGRVTTDSLVPIAGANIYATMAPEREVFQATTDSSGRYRIAIANGTGDYLVHISAVGRKAFRKRITHDTSETPSATFTVDAELEPEVTELPAVQVQTTRPRPRRGADLAIETGAAERTADGVVGAVSPDEAGDLNAVAGTVPGVTITAGGLSVLGLDAGQSRTTLNGMSFAGAALPRDIRTRTRVYSGTYDPARGGFSGAQVDVELGPGGTFTMRRSRFSLDTPPLQARDPLASSLAPRFTRVDASVGIDGSLGEGRWHHNLGAQFKRHSTDPITLLNANAAALEVAGVAPDSVARLLAELHSAGIPISTPGAPLERVTNDLILMGRLDRGLYKPNSFIASDRTWNLTSYARLLRSHALGLSPIATPGRGGEERAGTLMLQGAHSLYFGPSREWLNDLRSAITVRDERSTPYLRMPEGQVLVSSLLGDSSATTTSLVFGGNPALEARTRGWTWETANETQFYPPRQTRHRVKLYAQSRLDGSDRRFGGNAGILQLQLARGSGGESSVGVHPNAGDRAARCRCMEWRARAG